jgi:hypothetical protein
MANPRGVAGQTDQALDSSTPMPQAVNSFDVFDTLIARRSVEPHRVLRRLEAQTCLSGLAEARLAADRHLGVRGQPYTLRDIWHAVAALTGLDAATTDRLLDLEVRLEHDECHGPRGPGAGESAPELHREPSLTVSHLGVTAVDQQADEAIRSAQER